MKGVTASKVPHITHFTCCLTTGVFALMEVRTNVTVLKTSATVKWKRFSQKSRPTSCSETGMSLKTGIALPILVFKKTTTDKASSNNAGTYKKTARHRRVAKSCWRVG